MSKPFGDDESNMYPIDQYSEIMEEVEDFVLYNIQDLVELRLNQTSYKQVSLKMSRHIKKVPRHVS